MARGSTSFSLPAQAAPLERALGTRGASAPLGALRCVETVFMLDPESAAASQHRYGRAADRAPLKRLKVGPSVFHSLNQPTPRRRPL